MLWLNSISKVGQTKNRSCFAINTMRDLKIPEYDFRAGLLRMIAATIALAGIGVLTVNALSERRILACARSSGTIQCRLTTKQMLTPEAKVAAFDSAKLRKAIVRKKITTRTGRLSRYEAEATLVTNQGDFWISSMNDDDFTEKHRIVDKINAFLENPRSPALRVESRYTNVFWIGTAIFFALLVFFSFGILMSWWLVTSNSNTVEDKSDSI